MTILTLTLALLLAQDPAPVETPVETPVEEPAETPEDDAAPVEVSAREALLERLSKIQRALELLEESGGEREKRLVSWALSELSAARELAGSPQFAPASAELPPSGADEAATPAEPGDGASAAAPLGPPAPLSPALTELVRSGDLPTPWTLSIPQPVTKKVSSWGEQFRHPTMADEWHAPPPGLMNNKHSLLNEGSVKAARLAPLTASGLWIDGDSDTGNSIRWGGIAHGAADWTFRECLFKDIGDEHGLYLKSCWDLTFERCRFENIGSQGIQVAWRDKESREPDLCLDPNGDGQPAQVRISECVFLEVGQESGGRPSYAISLFERQPWTTGIYTDATIERCWLESQRHPNNAMSGGPYYSFGAIMVHGRNRVVLDSNVVRYRRPNRAIVQIWDCDEVVIRGGEYAAGLIDIRNCRKVTVEGVTGGAEVQVGSGKLYTAPISRDLKVQHRGPVTQDIQLGN